MIALSLLQYSRTPSLNSQRTRSLTTSMEFYRKNPSRWIKARKHASMKEIMPKIWRHALPALESRNPSFSLPSQLSANEKKIWRDKNRIELNLILSFGASGFHDAICKVQWEWTSRDMRVRESTRIHENSWESTRIRENPWESTRIHENSWEYMRICKNPQESTRIQKNLWEFTRIHENPGESRRILKNTGESIRRHKNPRESTRIYKNPRESTRIRKNPRESKRILENPQEFSRIHENPRESMQFVRRFEVNI